MARCALRSRSFVRTHPAGVHVGHLAGEFGALEGDIHHDRDADALHELHLAEDLLAHLARADQADDDRRALGFQVEQPFVNGVHAGSGLIGSTMTFSASPEAAIWKASATLRQRPRVGDELLGAHHLARQRAQRLFVKARMVGKRPEHLCSP